LVQQYLNLVRFPVALQFRERALGLRRDIAIGPLNGTIHLPRSNVTSIAEPFSTLKAPGVRQIAYAVRVHNHGRENYDRLWWGKYFTWHSKDPKNTAVASIAHAAISFSAVQAGGMTPLKVVAEQCHNHLPAWYSKLADWIEVLTKVDLDAAHSLQRVVEGPRLNTVPWISIERGQKRYDYVNAPGVAIGSDGKDALDGKLWSAALRGANRGLRPAEERLLLRDARAALARRHPRRAVLDAATVAELVIEPALRRALLRRNPQSVVDHLLKTDWQFARRKELMLALGMWLPPTLDQDLMKRRNKAIHENAIITQPQAKAAVDIAEQLANHYVPLKVP
jgi:hypothetical protein